MSLASPGLPSFVKTSDLLRALNRLESALTVLAVPEQQGLDRSVKTGAAPRCSGGWRAISISIASCGEPRHNAQSVRAFRSHGENGSGIATNNAWPRRNGDRACSAVD